VSELVKPFVSVWEYAAKIGGFPGQALLFIGCIMLLIGILTWFGNKK